MCGLVGVVGEPKHQNRRLFEELLMVDTLRGEDSTGVILVDNKTIWTQKVVGLPNGVIRSQRYTKKVRGKEHNITHWLGHNRWATKGHVTRKNAHPFQHGHITGMHNGTLNWDVPVAMGKKFGTDSESIIASIAERGIQETWSRYVADNGAAALLWYDAREKTTNFISNAKRPLFFGFNDEDNLYLIASELWMIEAICIRNNLKIENKIRPNKNFHFRLFYNPDTRKVEYESTLIKPKYTVPSNTSGVWPRPSGQYPHVPSGRPPWKDFEEQAARKVSEGQGGKNNQMGGTGEKPSERGREVKNKLALGQGSGGGRGGYSEERGKLLGESAGGTGREPHDRREFEGIRKNYRFEKDSAGRLRAIPKDKIEDTPAAVAAREDARNRVQNPSESQGAAAVQGKISVELNKVIKSLQEKVLNKDMFEKQFTECCFFPCPNELDYDTSIIIDSNTAACESCFKTIVELGGDPLQTARAFANQA